MKDCLTCPRGAREMFRLMEEESLPPQEAAKEAVAWLLNTTPMGKVGIGVDGKPVVPLTIKAIKTKGKVRKPDQLVCKI